MQSLLLVMAGGALGSGARFLVQRWMLLLLGPLPWGTLTVNLVGGLLMGLLAGSLLRLGAAGEAWRLFVAVGMLGGFTTFSSFALDTVTLWERGAIALATGYVLVSMVGAILALASGLAIARSWA